MKYNKFISFEGIDGSGKTTQIKLISKKLLSRGENVVVLREPGGTLISERIRKILLDKNNSDLSKEAESLLFFASRNQLLKEKIIPMLKKGNFIISDRFNDSTIAYQGYGINQDIDRLETISKFATLNKQPELTFYLDISADLSIKRRKALINDRIENKGIEYLKKVRDGFLLIAEKEPLRIIKIDGSLDENRISDMIWNIIKEKYEL